LSSPHVDFADLVIKTIASQANAVCPEAVCFDDLRPGVRILTVNARENLRLAKIDLFQAMMKGDALLVEVSSGGAVADNNTVVLNLQEICHKEYSPSKRLPS
jgi:hypothetical protein